MADDINLNDDEATVPTESTSQALWNGLHLSNNTWFDRFFVPALLLIQIAYTVWRFLSADVLMGLVSILGIVLMLAFAGFEPIQRRFLGNTFTRSHAFFLTIFWIYSQLFIFFYKLLAESPSTGKESENFYVLLVLLLAVTFRLLLSLYGLTPSGYKILISRIPFWEQVMVALNEFISASILSFVAGRLIARFIQSDIFTLNSNIYYNSGLVLLSVTYYFVIQLMWIAVWNRWLSRNNVWVRLARGMAPIALVIALVIVARHFANLSDPRTANLLGAAFVEETILALSPIFLMMIFFILVIVYSGGRGLRRMLIPNKLMEHMPDILARPLRTISDMDLLLMFAVLTTVIPLQLLFFNNDAFIGELQARLQGNALIDSSGQALALIFGSPFYIVALLLMLLYAMVLANRNISARERNAIVDRLPLTLIIMFVITLYLAAIPFSQVLTSGRIPNFEQDLGYILAFDVLIPLVLFYAHYYLLIRLPYGLGQTRWRDQHAVNLEARLVDVDNELAQLQTDIHQCEVIWKNRDNLKSSDNQQIDMLFDLIDLNGRRDRLNMDRLQMLSEKQELQDVTDAPISLRIASLPNRIIQYGIPLVLFFKIYEWAIVNDGLREVANNPNTTILGFFRDILENTNF